jgi:hyperosmotically inducible protein
MKRYRLTWVHSTVAVLVLCAASACATSRATPRSSAAPDDQTLRMRVETSLMNTAGVHANEVTAEVSQAVATLTGTVHTQAEVDAAVAAARRVDGVKDVRSNLRIQ